MTVVTSDLDTFLEELFADKEKVERKIVRLTYRHDTRGGAPIERITLRATARVAGEILALNLYLGENWGSGLTETEKLQSKGDAALRRIEEACKELGLELRGGTHE